MVIDYNLLGKRIARIRKERGLTQEKLAEATCLANNYISNIENNRSIPSLETFVKLCDALDVTPDEILIGASHDSTNYMNHELQNIVSKCTPKEKKLILSIAELIINQRNSKI